MKFFSKYVSGGNPRTVARLAAELITARQQWAYPRAHEIGDSAAVVVRRQSGETQTYTIPWVKSGTPLTGLGASPGPKAAARRVPLYQQTLERIRHFELPRWVNVKGFGALTPVFTWPGKFITFRPTRMCWWST